MPRKKIVENEILENKETVNEEKAETEAIDIADGTKPDVESECQAEDRPKFSLGMLKVNLDEDEEDIADERAAAWNELSNANRAHRIVSVIVAGLEKTQLAGNVVVAYYKEQRIVIPMTEMMINLDDDKKYLSGSLDERLSRICNTMLGAEIDVIIKGMDKKSGSVVASRRDAMNRKREKFYLTPLSDGLPQVREGRIVEARVIAVTPMVARIEIFGVETSVSAAELSWDWIADVSDKYQVGDKLPVLVSKIEGETADNLKVSVDIKSITPNTSKENLEKCVVQGKYIGEITNVNNGVVFLRLKIGVNAIAHTNYDKRTPGKGDLVSFVITRINPDYGNVSGIISRIIKQNI